MAYEGELVKLENGRWARFQRCTIEGAGSWDAGILVAVELEERYQLVLSSTEESLSSEYLQRGGAMQLRMEEDADGAVAVRLEEATLH